jgi:hypothetical protein
MEGSPQIVPRSEWQANEAIKRAPPRYAKAVSLAIVHHTAGTNAYSPSASAAIVRGIELYHVRGNHWNDIGYNFLADRYGQVFEGRAGGIDRNVIGAQAQGFNTGSVGVALIGNYNTGNVTSAERALVSLLAWRLDVAHVDPAPNGRLGVRRQSEVYKAGKTVELRAISGHRDTGFVPRTRLYSQLPSIAADVAATGLPALRPGGEGALGQADHSSAPVAAGRLDRDGARPRRNVVARATAVAPRSPGRGTPPAGAAARTWTMEAGAATEAGADLRRAAPARDTGTVIPLCTDRRSTGDLAGRGVSAAR